MHLSLEAPLKYMAWELSFTQIKVELIIEEYSYLLLSEFSTVDMEEGEFKEPDLLRISPIKPVYLRSGLVKVKY